VCIAHIGGILADDLFSSLHNNDLSSSVSDGDSDTEDQLSLLSLLGDEWVEEQSFVNKAGTPVYTNEQIIEQAIPYYRRIGFPYRKLPIHVCMQEINNLACTDPDKLLRTNTAYAVADTYHPHRFSVAAAGKKSPIKSFNSDKYLARAIRLALQFNMVVGEGMFSTMLVVAGTQACANFRPGFACMMYRKYCKPGDTVLDTSTGYGGRLVGFMASGVAGKYIGIDPNVPTHQGNVKMASDLGFADKVELYNLPAEDVSHDVVRGRCDFAFTSPPYFAKERYSTDDTQSWVRYKTGDAWRDGFLAKMLALQYAGLKPGAYSIVNIADVTISGKYYPLAKWTKEIAVDLGFDYLQTMNFDLTRRFGQGNEDVVANEPVIILRKPA
jgi:hypothetical protein